MQPPRRRKLAWGLRKVQVLHINVIFLSPKAGLGVPKSSQMYPSGCHWAPVAKMWQMDNPIIPFLPLSKSHYSVYHYYILLLSSLFIEGCWGLQIGEASYFSMPSAKPRGPSGSKNVHLRKKMVPSGNLLQLAIENGTFSSRWFTYSRWVDFLKQTVSLPEGNRFQSIHRPPRLMSSWLKSPNPHPYRWKLDT